MVNMSRRDFIRGTLGVGAASVLATCGYGRSLERPNIVFLMSDDHRSLSMGCAGDRFIKTPNMDMLAAKGMRFENCYASSPLCMASRATVMTGMYEYKTGCNFATGKLSADHWNDLAYPVQLRKAGYRTGFAGKWGFPLEVSDYARQFDKWGGFAGSGQGSYVTADNASLKPYAKEYPHVTRALGAFGRDFIRESAKTEQPFCLSLSFKAPHKPHNTIDPEDRKLYRDVELPRPDNWGPEYLEKTTVQARLGRQYVQRDEWDADHYDEHMRSYYQLISGVDSAIGVVLDELDRQGVADNTVVIYTSDNGYFCGAHGLQGKVLPYDDAALIPLIVYDPRCHKGRKSRVCDAVVGNIDFAPTILELAGLAISEKADGASLMPLVRGTAEDVRESLLVIQNWGWTNNDHNRALAVVTKRWKYIVWCYADENVGVSEELFDLKSDPLETRNLVAEADVGPVLERMRKYYDSHHEHWSKHCVDAEDYTRHRRIFDRRLPWRQKQYRGLGGHGDATGEKKLKAVYKELTGKEPLGK